MEMKIGNRKHIKRWYQKLNCVINQFEGFSRRACELLIIQNMEVVFFYIKTVFKEFELKK